MPWRHRQETDESAQAFGRFLSNLHESMKTWIVSSTFFFLRPVYQCLDAATPKPPPAARSGNLPETQGGEDEAGFSRVALAQKIGCDSSKLASYEHARTPVPYWVASKIGEATDRNQAWIATGEKPAKPFLEVGAHIEEEIPPRMLFSEAYDNILMEMVIVRLAEIARAADCQILELESLGAIPDFNFPPLGTPPGEEFLFILRNTVEKQLAMLWIMMPEELYGPFNEALSIVLSKFFKETMKN